MSEITENNIHESEIAELRNNMHCGNEDNRMADLIDVLMDDFEVDEDHEASAFEQRIWVIQYNLNVVRFYDKQDLVRQYVRLKYNF
jgi:hypothetical protein